MLLLLLWLRLTNPMTKQQIATEILSDMYQQEVTCREAGDIFGVRFAYFVDLRHGRYMKIPKKVWIKFRNYLNTNRKLR